MARYLIREGASLQPVRVYTESLDWLRQVLFPFSTFDVGKTCDTVLTYKMRESLLGALGKGFLILKREISEEMTSSSSACGYSRI